MTRRSHRLLACTIAVAATRSHSQGTVDDAIIISIATMAGMLPDRLEMHTDPGDPDSGWCKHRTVTHSLAFTITIAVLAGILTTLAAGTLVDHHATAEHTGRLAGTGVLIGMLAHLAGDALTITGIPLLGPFTRRNLHLTPRPLRIPTGSTTEQLIASILTILLLTYASLRAGTPPATIPITIFTLVTLTWLPRHTRRAIPQPFT